MAFYLSNERGERSLDFFELFGTVVVENKDAINALSETSDEAEKTGESAKKIGDGFKKSGEVTKSKLAEIAKKAGKTTDEVKAEAAELARSYEEAGMDSASAMKKAYEDIEAGAEKSSKGSQESGKNIIGIFGKVAKAGTAVVSAIIAIGTAMAALAENTREYRLEMGKLETAFSSAGHSTEAATETYQTLVSVLGETDRAVEASQHIAKLCESEEQMKAMTDACIGAFALFDDSLPIEGLMEAANETAKTGQLTGVLVDALNWAGSSEEEFQKRLDACNSERERAALITEELIALYAESAEAYKLVNEDIIEATAAQDKLNAATARWGEIFEPILTDFKEGWADIIDTLADWVIFNGLDDSLTGVAETSGEVAVQIETLKGRLAELYKTKPHLWTDAQNKEYLSLSIALENAEEQYSILVEREQQAAAQAEATARVTADSTAEFATVTEQYVADAQALFERFAETYDGIYNRIEGWFKPFEKASITVSTSVDSMMTAMQSQIDFNNSYSANLQSLKEYGLGSLADAFQSYGAEGAAYAQAIVAAVENAGGATTEEGQKIIQGFIDINQQVTESQSELAQTTALMNGEFESALQEMNDSYEAAIDSLDKSVEATQAAIDTFEGFLDGMNAAYPQIEEQLSNFGDKIAKALKKGVGVINLPVNFQISPTAIPGAETGLDYVPYDNYLVYLHKGEAVLTAEEANAWRAGKGTETNGNTGDSGSGSVTVNQYIEAVVQTPVELASATAAYFEQARWVM